ncbi:MAG TPA: hypothetical protein PKL35_07585 [Methanoregulaceae archaeon]|nr:hypothetical protein [Methanoregulaceae archaeon]
MLHLNEALIAVQGIRMPGSRKQFIIPRSWNVTWIMDLSEYLAAHPEKSRELKSATGCRCENCSLEYPLALLEVHTIGSTLSVETPHIDLQYYLLVLCPSCSRSFRSGKVALSLQRDLVRLRNRQVRRRMRAILSYQPKPYTPSVDFDPEVIFREVVSSTSPDLCLNGG